MTQTESDSLEIPDLESVRRLIPKYERPGPRYTSYPTAPVWTDAFGEEKFRAALARAQGRPLCLYIHIPFCERLCTYCACNRLITRDHSVAGPYLDALEREAAMLADAIGGERRCIQLAVGGGTPTYLSEAELERMCRIADAHFPPAPDAERSIEVDPRVTTRGQLEVLARHSFNRISLGVQDMDPKVQRSINRVQPREQTQGITDDARALGFGSVNFDLIYGLPFQTVESFDDTLTQVIEMRPDRIALYSYAHVTWVSKQQRGFETKDLPSAERKLAIFLRAIQRLSEAGYLFFGLDHFALPEDELSVAAGTGDLRRNFMGYTTRASVDLIALGASGISELADAYAQSLRGHGEWAERIEAGRVATMRGWSLSQDDLRRKWLIQRLMCQGEISAQAYEEAFGECLAERIPALEDNLAPLVEDG
ncbi:MAG: oxygen-independent coproporphyrinogen III oxidase, partial [Myxococcota bacterium]